MSCFDDAPEFIELDNRQFRLLSAVTKEQMENKHEVLFPRSLVEGRTILDLGCCLGATGHWCLSEGATHYTGVEVQETYATAARMLMSKYHPNDAIIIESSIEDFLATNTQQYDVVAILGVIYVFTDYYSILKKITDIARESVVVESLYPDRDIFDEDFCGVQFFKHQRINLADENASLYGRGTRISPKGLKWVMRDFAFESFEGLLIPRPILGTADVYTVTPDTKGEWMRFLIRFKRIIHAKISLSQDLQGEKKGGRASWIFDAKKHS